ncbi:MAG: 3-keto-5-aminohexanoate cleavage protein [Deltaproteobacteria bacterium]|nr:3-keto-5-aminohexanoate cleavage protein [Candidatus Zymogenaceae bacterium]
MSDKVIITAALTGAATRKEQNPAVPYTPEEFAEDAYRVYNSGGSIVHVHVRDPEHGAPTHEIDKIKTTIDAIKAKCPEIIINMSSAIGPWVTQEQRIAPIVAIKPPMASLNTNSMNFGIANWKTGEVPMEIVFENTFAMLIDFNAQMKANGVKPELEVYDMGGLYNVLLVRKQGIFEEPMHFQMVFGVAGGVPYEPGIFAAMKDRLPENATFSVCGVGPNQFPANMTSVVNGGHMRVGLEDNTRMPNGELAKGSWEQVEWCVEVAKLAGREIATPDEARKMLKLKN